MNKNIITDNFWRKWVEINGAYFIYEEWSREELKDFINKTLDSALTQYKIRKLIRKLS